MGLVVLANCVVTKEEDWVPIVLEDNYIQEAKRMGKLQYEQSRKWNLKSTTIHNTEEEDFNLQVWSKFMEFAIKQWAGGIARVTNPGEFHDWPDVGQANARFILDPKDGLMIHDGDQGELPIILGTTKDISFKDKTIWLIGWGMTDLLRRHYVMINQFRENKNWGKMGNDFLPHEQFIYPRAMLNPIKTLSKEFINTPYVNPKKSK